jgi:adenine-specific DNA-methyltransferase
MATIETLIEQIGDKALRDAIASEVGELKKRLDWGLVFERHLPENVRALSAPIKVGSVVWERCSAKPRRFRVRANEGSELVLAPEPEKTTAPADTPTERLARDTVLVEQDFAEPIFPILTPIGSTVNGPAERPRHVVVEGENYHAIQALLMAYEGQVDVMYLDPPFNTGSRDWSYNNDYVDPTDTYRPSRWLAFMERRLRIARRLLKPDGVLVVTIDEHEVHHLGMLLEQLFPDAYRQMVTIVINPKGVTQGRFSRVEEYAQFAFFGSAAVTGRGDDYLTPLTDDEPDDEGRPRWKGLLRSGTNARREDRKKMFYPVLVDATREAVVGVGETLPYGEDPDLEARIDGYTVAWPIRRDGSQGNWGVGRTALKTLIDHGYVALGGYDAKRHSWALSYLSRQAQEQVAAGVLEVISFDKRRNVIDVRYTDVSARKIKTVWHRTSHDAGAGGSDLINAFIGRSRAFPFPKSLYAVRDTLAALVRDKPDALVMDFFAGSGTTLHATLLLNAEDGGNRRCVLVTNNELNYETASALHRKGLFRGDPEFEAAGVFESATRPRVAAAVTGVRPDGKPAVGTYVDHGRDFAAGFPENVEFFRLDYLEPAEVEFGLRFSEIHPLLWLRAGGIGEREDLDPSKPLGLPAQSPYAVLFDPSGLPDLLKALEARPDITHVFVVADSAEAFSLVCTDLPRSIEPARLYRNYLETMRGATR